MHLLCTFLNELMIDLFSKGYHNNNYFNIQLSLFFIYCIVSLFVDFIPKIWTSLSIYKRDLTDEKTHNLIPKNQFLVTHRNCDRQVITLNKSLLKCRLFQYTPTSFSIRTYVYIREDVHFKGFQNATVSDNSPLTFTDLASPRLSRYLQSINIHSIKYFTSFL